MTLKRNYSLVHKLIGTISLVAVTLFTLNLFQYDYPWVIWALAGLALLMFVVVAWKRLDLGLIILMVELVLGGGSGRWTELPGGVSIRMAIFGIVMLIWLIQIIQRKYDLRYVVRSPLTPFVLIFAFIYPLLFGGLMGGLNGNTISNIFADSNGQLFYLILLPLLTVFTQKKKIIRFLKIYLGTITLSALWQSIVYCLFITKTLGAFAVRGVLRNNVNFLGQIGRFPNGAYRLYLASGIYFQSGLALAIALVLRMKRWMFKLPLLASIVILVFMISGTYTRGYWFGAIFAVLVILIFVNWRAKFKIIATALIGFSLAFAISSFVFGYSLKDFYVHRLLSTFPITLQEDLFDEDTLSDTYSADPLSVTIKIEQAKILWGEIKKKPLMGHGFGTVMPTLGRGFSFELSYLDMIFKFGFVGIIVWLYFIALIFWRGIKTWHRNPSGTQKAILVGMQGALFGLLFTSATNPYILASFGMGHLIFTAFITEVLYQKRFGTTREWIRLRRKNNRS
ncbi:O-antigen ligase family protein [Patescibacteria group bacterium]